MNVIIFAMNFLKLIIKEKSLEFGSNYPPNIETLVETRSGADCAISLQHLKGGDDTWNITQLNSIFIISIDQHRLVHEHFN